MSRLSRGSRDPELTHARARLLASEAIDTELEPGEAEWLTGHLQGCLDCQTVADEYQSLRNELRSLTLPEPPRDLWARTSAALDEVDRSSRRTRAATRLGFGGWAASRSSFGAALAVTLVVVISGVSLLSQVPGNRGAGSARPTYIALGQPSPLSAQAPVAVVDGTGYWIKRDGQTYEIQSGSAKCSGIDGRCSVSADSGTTMGSITSTSPVFAALAPDARQAAVWNGDTVAILPLAPEAPATVAIDQMTPRPTTTDSAVASVVQATPTITATSTVAASATATPTATATATPTGSSAASPTASESASPSPSPTVAPSPAIPVTVPTAILNDYKVVGRDPEFSADGLWVAFSAAPTNLTNGPDLFVWKVGQERAQAVTTAHADLFSGWFGTQILVSELSVGPNVPAVGAGASDSATPASSDSGSPSASTTAATTAPTLAAPSGPTTTSYLFDPATQNALRIDRSMLLPVADPTRTFLIYWSGTIEVDAASGQLKTGKGNLYLDTWANLKLEPVSLDGIVPVPTASATSASQEPSASASPSPSPSPSPEATASSEASASPTPTPEPSASPVLPELLQVAAGNSVENWVVDWDATGEHVAVWVADSASLSVGVVNLFAIDRGSGRIATDGPLFHARGLPSIQFDKGRLVYTTPAEGSDGKTFLVQIPPTPSLPSSSPSPSPTASETPSATDGPGS
jgi:hypothetical protein